MVVLLVYEFGAAQARVWFVATFTQHSVSNFALSFGENDRRVGFGDPEAEAFLEIERH